MKKLRRKILTCLEEREPVTEYFLKSQLRKIYMPIPEAKVDSAVDTMLLQLSEEDAIILDNKQQIMLSEKARSKLEEHKENKNLQRSQKIVFLQDKLKLKNKKLASRKRHEKLKQELGELAYLLGNIWKPEHDLEMAGKVKVDVVWYRKPGEEISHAFEVQHRGDPKRAIVNLEAIRGHFRSCRLFLLVDDEKEISTIKLLLGVKRDTSIEVLSVRQLEACLNTLKKMSNQYRIPLINVIKQLM